MTHTSQGLISGALLLAVRQTELQRGQLLAHHGRHPAAPRPTQRKLHKITDRHERKLRARAYHPGNPVLNLDPHLHSAQRFKHAA